MGKLWPWAAGASLALALAVTVAQRPAPRFVGDELDYIAAARDLTGPSRFPPGWPMLLAPWSVDGMYMIAAVLAVLLVVAIWWAAVEVGGWRAGATAGVLVVLSPGVTGSGSTIMADGPAALLVVAGLIAVLRGRHLLAGVLTALSGWLRLVHVAFVAALHRRAWPVALAVVVLLVAWQVVVKGSLLGYEGDSASFSPAYITRPLWLEHSGQPAEVGNLVYFPAVLFAGFGSLIAPGVGVLGVVGLRRRWDDGARFAAGIVVLALIVYLPYYFQSARFMLPAGCVLVVYAAGLCGHVDEKRG